MSARELALSMLAMSVETALLMACLRCVLQRRRVSRGGLIAAAFLVTAVQLYTCLIHTYQIRGTVILLLMEFLLSLTFFKAKVAERLAYLLVFEYILLSCDLIALSLGNLLLPKGRTAYAENGPEAVALMLASKGMAALLAFLCTRGRSMHLLRGERGQKRRLLAPLAALWLLLCTGFLLWRRGRWEGPVASIAITVSFGAVNYLNVRLNTLQHELMEAESGISEYVAAHRTWLRQIEAGSEEVRRTAHDLRKHFVYLLATLRRGRPDEAAAYLESLDRTLRGLAPRSITGNDVADAMLSEKEAACREKGVRFLCAGRLPEHLRMDPYDLTRLIGNLLDNAANACRQGDTLRVEFRYGAGLLRVRVRNPIDAGTPRNPRAGQGMGIVRGIAEKYDGWVDVHFGEKEYEILAYLSENEASRFDQ